MKTSHKGRRSVCQRCGSHSLPGFKTVKRDGIQVCEPCAKFLDAQLRLEVNGG